MDLKELREKIDFIDQQLIDLFSQRMQVAAQIGAYKKEHNLPVLDPIREQEKLNEVAGKAGPELADATRELYQTLMRLSREHQESSKE